MFVLIDSFQSFLLHTKLTKKNSFFTLFLLLCFALGRPARAFNYDEEIPLTPSIYILDQEQSIIHQTGGNANVDEYYHIKGQITLYAESYGNYASFWEVNVVLTESSNHLYTNSFSELFNTSGLTGAVTDSKVITFTGKTSDGTDSDVTLTFTVDGDNISVAGDITPPFPNPNNDYYYQITAVAERVYGGGLGTIGIWGYPYIIKSAKHMNTVGLNPNHWSNGFILTKDINMSVYKNKEYNIIGYYKDKTDNKPFTGIFLGNNHKISGFNYRTTDTTNRIALFGYINSKNTQITNLGIIDPNVYSSKGEYVSSLAAQITNGTLNNCYVTGGHIQGASTVGGLVGRNGAPRPITDFNDNPCDAGILTNCRSSANVSGLSVIGGLIGSNDGPVTNCNASGNVSGDSEAGGLFGFNGYLINNCYTNASVSGRLRTGGLAGKNFGIIYQAYTNGTVNGQESVGGFVGDNNGGYLLTCWSSSTVKGLYLVGGFAGSNSGNINTCYSNGAVTGDLYVGGLVGENNLTISSCYSSGNISVQYGFAGGLVGINQAGGSIVDSYSPGRVTGGAFTAGLLGSNDGVVLRCYASGPVSGLGGLGGLVAQCTDKACVLFSFWDKQTTSQNNSAGGTGKTTAEMKSLTTFDNWHKGYGDEAWAINNGIDYPRLLWEKKGGVVIDIFPLTDYLSGNGQADNPFLISQPQQLNLIGLYPSEWDKHYRLTTNLNMSAIGSTKFNTIGYYRIPFKGVFDGSNYTISNLKFNTPDQNYVGLFGCVGSLIAEIKNLGLIAPNIKASDKNYVGPLAGYLNAGAITNCYTRDVNITGCDYIGGIVGYNKGTIAACYSTGDVNGIENTGGLTGFNNGTIVSCYSTAVLYGIENVGGLAGGNSKSVIPDYMPVDVSVGDTNLASLWVGVITDCYHTGIVIGDSVVGGMVGDNSGIIIDSFATGIVSANTITGGIAGSNSGRVENAYSIGLTTGYDKIGGLVGNNNGLIKSSYSISNVNGDNWVGGLTGYNYGTSTKYATITDCNATGTVYGRLSAGGLAGYNGGKTSITRCFSESSIAGYEWVGGFVGKNEGSISQCYASGNVSGSLNVGGFAGWNLISASIANSYANGNVMAVEWAGGLVGTNYGSISKCYSNGAVAGNIGTIGGLAGMNFGSVSASFWDTQTSSQTSSAGGTGKNTAQMKTKSTFTSAGWDFTGVWKINQSIDYPRLLWEH
jgi:hypothetical protein